MFAELFLATFMVLLTVLVHGAGLYALSRLLRPKRGYDLIKTRTEELEAAVICASSDEQRAEFQRDLRYWRARLATAQIAPAGAVRLKLGSR